MVSPPPRHDTKAGQSGKALTAPGWILARNLLRTLHPLLPAGDFEV